MQLRKQLESADFDSSAAVLTLDQIQEVVRRNTSSSVKAFG